MPVDTVKDYRFWEGDQACGNQMVKNRTYLQQSHFMEEAGWNVQMITDIRPLRRKIIEVNVLVGIGILFSYSLLALLKQRQRSSEQNSNASRTSPEECSRN